MEVLNLLTRSEGRSLCAEAKFVQLYNIYIYIYIYIYINIYNSYDRIR